MTALRRGGGTAGKNPLLVILSGPSGVGKDALLTKLKKSGRPYYFIVTVTTRPHRPGEKEGVPYHFVTPEEFQGMIERGELLEWATVYGNLYGTPKRQVKEALARGQDVILKVDVQGAATIKGIAPNAVFIFLAPPSMEELIERLKQRNTESPQTLQARLEAARREMEQLPMFDYVVVNPRDRADKAAAQIEAIISAEKCRVSPRAIRL